MVNRFSRLVAIGQECNVNHLAPKMFVFHFYELVEQTVDQLVKRSIDWSNGQLVSQLIDWLVIQSTGSSTGQVNGQL